MELEINTYSGSNQEFKLRVQSGEDKFSTCQEVLSVDKDVSIVDVKEVQAKLTEECMSLMLAIFLEIQEA